MKRYKIIKATNGLNSTDRNGWFVADQLNHRWIALCTMEADAARICQALNEQCDPLPNPPINPLWVLD